MVRFLLSSLFFILSVDLFILFGIHFIHHYSLQSIAFASAPLVQDTSAKLVIPRRMFIPSLEKTLSVFPARISHNVWETTDKGVSYLITSASPGEKGNAIFYGHNFTNLLGDLKDITIGSMIMIEETDGSTKHFTVTDKKIVDPTDISIIKETNDSQLTLYTCTGFLDSKRLVVIAKPL